MKLKADDKGFLVGAPIGEGQVVGALSAIKSDTGAILAAMRQLMRGAPRGRSGRGSSYLPAASPAGRASRAFTSRDAATGRLVPASAPSREQDLATVAQAAQAIARTAETQRRDDKHWQRQSRGSDGRFGAGGKKPGGGNGGGGRGGEFSGIGASGGAALDAAQQVDPLLGAVGELRAVAGGVRNVVSPLGRAGAGLFGGGAAADKPTPWLRRMWRELRGMRSDDAKNAKAVQRKLDRGGGGGGGGPGGSLLDLAKAVPAFLSNLVPSFAGPATAVGASAAAAGGLAALWKGGKALAKGVAKRIPFLGPLLEAADAVAENGKIKNDKSLTPEEKSERQAKNAAGATGAVVGAGIIGAAAGSLAGPIGTAAGVVVGTYVGKKVGETLGSVSKFFESGRNGGAGVISTGKGDLGGKSYGSHQLSSKMGTLQDFLSSSAYGAQFAGLTPGSAEFDAKWRELAAGDKGFGKAQQDFMVASHYGVQMAKLKKAGIDLSSRSDALSEMVFSTATQFGPNTSLIQKALRGRDVGSMSDADIIKAVQGYKAANNETLFRSSSENVRRGTLRRAYAEGDVLLQRLQRAAVSGALPAMPGMPRSPALAAIPAMPTASALDDMTRVGSAPAPKPIVVQVPAPAGQDVRDRGIAHVVTGGMGAVGPSR